MFGIDKSVDVNFTYEGQRSLLFKKNAQYVMVFGLKTFRILSVSFLLKGIWYNHHQAAMVINFKLGWSDLLVHGTSYISHISVK